MPLRLANLPDLTGQRVVQLPDGPVLIGDLGGSDNPFEPVHDLIAVALRLAATVESTTAHRVMAIDVSGSGPLRRGDSDPVLVSAGAGITGRVSLECVRRRGRQELEVELFEAATPADAELLAADAESGPGAAARAGLVTGSLFATVAAQDRRDLDRFRDLTARALASVTT